MELGFEPISLIPKSVFLTVKNCNSKLHFYSQFTQFTVEQIIPATAVGKNFFFFFSPPAVWFALSSCLSLLGIWINLTSFGLEYLQKRLHLYCCHCLDRELLVDWAVYRTYGSLRVKPVILRKPSLKVIARSTLCAPTPHSTLSLWEFLGPFLVRASVI